VQNTIRSGIRHVSKSHVLSLESLETRCLLAGDLIAHWRAHDLTAFQADGDAVAQWADGVAAIVAEAAGTPHLRAAQLGGRAVVEFNASDGVDQLLVDRLTSPMSGRGDFTIAVVFATDSPSLIGGQGHWFENTTLVDGSSLGFANDWGISINAAGQVTAGLGFGQGLASHTLRSSQTGWNDSQWHTAVYQRQGATIWLQVDEADPVQMSAHANPLTGLHLSMGSQKFRELPFDGILADVQVYDGALDESERAALRQSLHLYYDNQPPQAIADEYTLPEDRSGFFQTASNGLLSNDRDAEGDRLTAVLVQAPSFGKISVQPDGSFFYVPDPDFFGTDQFTYVAQDLQQSAPATVTLNVTPIHDGATALADVYKALPAEPLTVTAAEGVLANDRNPDRVPLRVEVVSDVSVGSLVLAPDGSLVYNAHGFAGVTTFSYRIDDGTALSDPVAVTLVVNTPPIAADDQYAVDEDASLAVHAGSSVLQNDVDADGDSLSVSLVDGPTHGTLTLDPQGSLVYQPRPDYFGQDQFRYQLFDGTDQSNVATVRIDVRSVNDLPVTQADGYVGLPDESITVSAGRGVLANDSDVDDPALTAVLVADPAQGTLQFSADGSFVYVPRAGFIGGDSFSYRTRDTASESAITQVVLTITRTPVTINEFMTSNSSSLPTRIALKVGEELTGDEITPDWIEIQNLVSQPVDLSEMSLTDDPNLPRKWTFPPGIQIPAEGYLIVYASGFDLANPVQDEHGRLHTNFALGRDSGYLALTAGSGTVLSEFAPYPPQRVDVSYGAHEGQTMYFPEPSPAAANSVGTTGMVSEPTFSVDRGFFTEPFVVEIYTSTRGSTLVYTTDGSVPSLSNGTQVPAPSGSVAPSISVPISGTTTLRAAAFRDGWLPTNVDTQTYLFTADILQQNVLDSTIVNDPQWGPQLEASLLALPTISLVAERRISLTENPTSVEMIFPDGSQGFQINSGIEHYGGHSIQSPKKNMRLSFKSKYGESSLKYDVFGEGAVDEFQQLLLRTGSHDTFFWTHPDGGRGNYLRNRWAFDRQLEMGQVAPHGRYVHVYINGTYAGMHHLMERPNADFMASYEGGYDFQYDALNAGSPVDGDLDAWQAMQRTEVIDDYAQLQQYLDVENYADYMLLQFYAGNDWDWNTNQNWMAARKREPGAGYVFFSWDSDVILRSTASANVVNRGGPGNLWNVRGGVKQHADFRMLMADRALKYFFDGGMLSDERLRADVTALADQIRLPMIAETARWGGRTYTPRIWESAVDWMLDRYAPEGPGGRAETVIEQLRRANVYPSIDSPIFLVNGQEHRGGYLGTTDELTVTAPAGVVYYLADGGDPRLPGGALHPDALIANGPIPLVTSQTLRLRARLNDEWSAVREATFQYNTLPADERNLRIAEVHYHPGDPTESERAAGFGDADDFEFIELVNVSTSTVDLSHVRFAMTDVAGELEGIAFDFAGSAITRLEPGERVVVVENLPAFTARYGNHLAVAGQWSGGLGNSSETISLLGAETLIQQFAYSDRWNRETDGDGYSLQVVDESADDLSSWARADGWRASRQIGGSPGSGDDLSPLVGDSNRDGVFNSSDLVLVFAAGQYEDAIRGNSGWEQGDWNGDGDFTTSDIVLAMSTGNYVAAARRGLGGARAALDAVWAEY
jgi:hypothetical protein